jgi:AMMECR1 domain-containing protein
VEQEELKNIVVSVDILSEPEKIDSENDLDPKRYGVIVSKGMRKGVLLPDLEGVDSVEKQLTIASQKAGIFSLDNVTIYRFTVQRFPERRD